MGEIEEQDIIEKLLMDFVELYNQVNMDMDSPQAADGLMRLLMDYSDLKNKNIDLYSVLDREFAGDPQIYILVLSGLFYVSKDSVMLDKAESLLFLEQLPLDAALRILVQIRINRFSNSFPAPGYGCARDLHLHLLQRLERELQMSWEYISYEERNHNLIALETDTLIFEGHAPSAIVLSIYDVLKYEMGYDVFILVNHMRMDTDDLENYWVFPYRTHYSPRLDGWFSLELKGKEITGYQQVIRKNDLVSVKNSLKIIYEKKPEFVWHIGGQSVFSDLLGKITSLVSMPCSKGYSVSEAPVLIPADGDAGVDPAGEEQAVIRQRGQKVYVMQGSWRIDPPREKHQRISYGFQDEDFVIAIVGNRLETEMDEDFIRTMEEIVERESRCQFMIVGKYQRKFSQETLQGRVKNLGYQDDLAGMLGMADLFLNPVRAGGGVSAVIALSVGVPVVTLPGGDVAFNVGEAFVCDSLEEVPALVRRYSSEAAFYHDQAAECERCYNKLISVSPAQECRKLIHYMQTQAPVH